MAASMSGVQKWPNFTVYYTPFDNHPAKHIIEAALKEVSNRTPIRFVKRTTELNYVTILFVDGNSSPVGMKGGEQFIELNANGGQSLHELCHTLGLIHEQERSDGQQIIRTYFKADQPIDIGCYVIPIDKTGIVNPSNPNMRPACNSINLTEYDPLSIMHYTAEQGNDYGKPGQWTMVLRSNLTFYVGVQDRAKLTKLDAEGLNSFYNPWSTFRPIPGGKTNAAPTMVTYNGKLYAFWNGHKDDGIFYATNDGTGWTSQEKIPGIGTRTSPAVAVYNNKLYVTYCGWHYDGIFSVSFDGRNWAGQIQIKDFKTKHAPALASDNSNIYLAWNNEHNDGIYYSVFNGTSWTEQLKIPNVGTNNSPALAMYKGLLFAAWNGYHNDGIFYSAFNGNNWTNQQKIGDIKTYNAPALTAHPSLHNPAEENLYLAWKPIGDERIWWTNYEDTNWARQVNTVYKCKTSQALCSFQGKLFMSWQHLEDDIITHVSM
jgi:hypothetical protein